MYPYVGGDRKKGRRQIKEHAEGRKASKGSCTKERAVLVFEIVAITIALASLISTLIILIEGVKVKNYMVSATSASGLQSAFATALPPDKFAAMFAIALQNEIVRTEIEDLMREVLYETLGMGSNPSMLSSGNMVVETTNKDKRTKTAYAEVCKGGDMNDCRDPTRLCNLVHEGCKYFTPCVIQHNHTACASFAAEAFLICAGA